MQSHAPIAAPQMSPCLAGSLDANPAGAPPASTPATTPRSVNPAAFLRNTNSIFSPNVPAAAGMGHTRVMHGFVRLKRTENTHSSPTSCCPCEAGLCLLCLIPQRHVSIACLDIACLTQCLDCECLKCTFVDCDIFSAACDCTVIAAGPASRQPELHSKAAAMAGHKGGDLDTRFNLG